MRTENALEPLAIIGIGCRFPGGGDGPAAFWDMLCQGTDAIVDVPPDRWNVHRFQDPDPAMPGKMVIRQGGFLKRPIDAFDALFFSISPREAVCLDPQQRFLLEVTWEALEDAGLVAERLIGADVGVYIGGFMLDTQLVQLDPTNRDLIGPHTATSGSMGMLSNRISYIFDFQGPSVSMDTACSSSLVAFHFACQDLWSGRCSLALTGGANLMINPSYPIAMSKGNFLSPDARCKAFDARANGYARGEGVGMIVLKPLAQARADGDPVYALVRATGVNQDGRTKGITVPNGASQQTLIRRVYQEAAVAPDAVTYVESHGTGTQVGDITEATALGRVVGTNRAPEKPCVIGSVKTNIGHLEAAAGIAGVIKAALCLKHRQIPPHLHLETPNPDIPFQELRLRPPQGLEPMPTGDTPPYAGVNSFGYGGTNAHVLLQAVPLETTSPAPGVATVEKRTIARLAPLSARSLGALHDLARAYLNRFQEREAQAGASLHDLVYSMSLRRDHHEHRLAVVAENRDGFAESLKAFLADEPLDTVSTGQASAGESVRPVFVFTGMGPQRWAMGRELWRKEPIFRQAIEEADQAFQHHSGWSILEKMFSDEDRSLMEANWVAQPANFVLQVGLAALWRSWGVEPAAVVGHSVGEVPAAYVAGALDLGDAACVSFHRSRLQQQVAGEGGMLAVGLPAEEVMALLDGQTDRVNIAALNSPSSVTLAGDAAPLAELAAVLETRGVFHRALQVEVAYHSPKMEPLRDDLLEALQNLRPKAARMPLYSTVTGRVMDETAHDAQYWWHNIRQSVRFSDAIDAMIDEGRRVFLEIGPHPVLAASIKEGLRRHGVQGHTLASLDRKKPEHPTILNTLGALYTLGYAVNWKGLYPTGGRFVPLPPYPWQHEIYSWVSAMSVRRPQDLGGYALLGDRAPTPQPVWETELTEGLIPYLQDHRVQGAVVFPGAAYVDAALAAQREISDGETCVLEEVKFLKALVIEEHDKAYLRQEIDEQRRSFSLYGRSSDREAAWTLHTTGKFSSARPAPAQQVDLAGLRARCCDPIDVEEFYAHLHAIGLDYGPTFRSIQHLGRQQNEALAEIVLHPTLVSDADQSPLYPTLLDAGFQTLIATLKDDILAESTVFVPVEINRVALHANPGPRLWSHGRMVQRTDEALVGDIVLYDESGTVLAEIRGLRCQALATSRTTRSTQTLIESWLHAYRWKKTAPRSATAIPVNREERWLIVAGRHGLGDRLAQSLRTQGVPCIIAHRAASFAHTGPDKIGFRPEHREDLARLFEIVGASPLKGIVYLGELDAQAQGLSPEDMDDWVGPLHLVQAMTEAEFETPPRLFLVTGGLHSVETEESTGTATEPALTQAPVWGLGRVLMNEHPEFACTLIDLERSGDPLDIEPLTLELLAEDRDEEIALRGAERFVHRLTRVRLPENEDVARPVSRPASYPFVLEIGMQGSVDSLRFRETQRRPPDRGEVEMQIHAVGLNFKDILKILNLLSASVLEGTYYGTNIGMEATATVMRVGAGVEDLKVGDEVVANINRGCFRSYVTMPVDELCYVLKLHRYSDIEQAGMPVAFVTALYGLHEIGRLQPGERVLLHSASGGVGLAAIQVARWCGAEIFATAGNPEKRAYLRALGIEHVMDSRSLEFAEEIMALTGGEGVDVVLNFIPGEGLTKSLSVLAPFGRFIEIGKQDIDKDHPLGLRPFNHNLTFSAVDIDRLLEQRPATFQRLLSEVWRGLDEGYFHPLPVTEYHLSDIGDACRYMMQAVHIGKIVLSMDDQALPVLPLEQEPPLFKTDATYLITGGLGGFGLAVAAWMVEQGAKNLVLLGRSGAATPEAQQALRALETKGARVVAAAVDVTEADQVEALLSKIKATMPPLRGVMHAAMVLDDGLLVDLNPARFNRVLAPKLLGAWNLHRLTQDAALDFFVLFSSISSLVGNPGQGSYAAANAFLDALAHYRRARGLPALSINWGVLAEVGVAAHSENLIDHLKRIGINAFSPAHAVEALGLLLRRAPVQMGIMDVDWQRWAQLHPGASSSPRFSHLMHTAAVSNPHDPLIRSLIPLSQEDRQAAITERLASRIAKVLRMPIAKLDVHHPLVDLGVDSLLAVELQVEVQQGFGVEYSVLEMLKGVSVAEIATHILDKMIIPEHSTDPDDVAPLVAWPLDSPALVDELSDEEVDNMLIEFLQSETDNMEPTR